MKTVQKNNLGRHCPECEDGVLHKTFKSELYEGVEFGDDWIECPLCGYSQKINVKKNRQHIITEE